MTALGGPDQARPGPGHRGRDESRGSNRNCSRRKCRLDLMPAGQVAAAPPRHALLVSLETASPSTARHRRTRGPSAIATRTWTMQLRPASVFLKKIKFLVELRF